LNFLHIILLGIIQGLTEFFPISSSGHLVLFQNLFGLKEPQIFVDIMLHIGTLFSLLLFLRKKIYSLAASLICFIKSPKKYTANPDVKWLLYLFIASIPTALIGYLFSDFFESLFASVLTVGIALLVTGAFLFITKYFYPRGRPQKIHALLIGILQGLAIVPGFSRSGFTIGGGLICGWKRKEAAEFSFLLSIPAILGASLFQLQKIGIHNHSWLLLLTGVASSAISGYLALSFLYNLVQKGKFFSFSFYCFAAGTIVLILYFI